MKEDPSAIGQGYLTATRYITMLTIPMGVGLALIARPLIVVIFTEKWIAAVPVVVAIAVYSAIRTIYSDGGAFKAIGRPDLTSKLHVVSLLLLIPVLSWVTITYESLVVVAWTQTILVSIICIFRLIVTSRVLNVRLSDIFKIILPTLVGSGCMFIAVWSVLQWIPADLPALQLLAAVSTGVLVYGGVMWWLQYETIQHVRLTLRTALSGD